jgi:hypothetical protein
MPLGKDIGNVDGKQDYPDFIDALTVHRVVSKDLTRHLSTNEIAQRFPEGEYLLVENRQPIGYEQMMPLGGLPIYHVDEKTASYWTQGWPGQPGWPENGNHYPVALLPADGLYQLESTNQRGDRGDLWSLAGANYMLNSTSVPNTKAYQVWAMYNDT